jgi:hypothetical protein
MRTATPDWPAAARDPYFVHLFTIALLGKTHDHLHDAHELEPIPMHWSSAKRTNAEMHWRAHHEGDR